MPDPAYSSRPMTKRPFARALVIMSTTLVTALGYGGLGAVVFGYVYSGPVILACAAVGGAAGAFIATPE